MEKSDRPEIAGSDGILLLDTFDEPARLLMESFDKAGFRGEIIVINDGGFLPENVKSLFRWFCYDDKKEDASVNTELVRRRFAGWKPGEPRFFNQIELPDYWEISASNNEGEIHDKSHLRGKIFFSDLKNRLVSEVDWKNEKGVTRCTDHYDSRGELYSRTIFDKHGHRFARIWFDKNGVECVSENYVTGDILTDNDGKTRLFRSRTDLAVEMIKELGAYGEKIFYNSLSIPLFVSERVESDRGHVLFWQEAPRADVPGNMQQILSGKTRTTAIYVQNIESYSRLISLTDNRDIFHRLGFVYSFERENRHSRDILICTNSDRIDGLDTLVRGLEGFTFHIAAVTEMSERLLAYSKYSNVRLYPVVRKEMADELFDKCDIYLDVNFGSEILSAVKRAFLNNMLILGILPLLHGRRYTSPENVFSSAKEIVKAVDECGTDTGALEERLAIQRGYTMSESEDAYRALI